MKILMVVMIVAPLWTVLATVLGCYGGRPTAGRRGVVTGEAWVWETLDRGARLANVSDLPSSHPLAHLGHTPSPPAA